MAFEPNRTTTNDAAFRVAFTGLKHGDAVSRLYQSGPYDKPVVIPAPFDPKEQTQESFTEEHVYELFEPLMVDLFKDGFDVWIVQTKTGQNIHEQAAEFAQVIDYAARRAGPEAQVIVVGFSLGGVTARLATARFEADPEWRAALGLRDKQPVSLIVFGDAPLEGAHFNLCLQQEIWKRGKAGVSNLNSCGAQQLLRASVSGLDRRQSPTMNWRRFYEQGEAVFFDPSGVCDRQGLDPNGIPSCICDPGPALLSVNEDGWPHGPRVIAFSYGMDGPMMCYGDRRDENRNGDRVCARVSAASVPHELQTGDDLYKFRLPVKRDITCKARPEDVEGGSRLSTVMTKDIKVLFWTYGLEQKAHGTFIPYKSALPAGAPFFDTMHNTHQGIHGSGYRPIIDWTVAYMRKAASTTSSSPHPVASSKTVVPVDDRTGDAPVTVTYPIILQEGVTTLTLRSTGPSLPRHMFGAPSLLFELKTTAVFSASGRHPITICIDYGAIDYRDETELMLAHHEEGGWIDRTCLRDRSKDVLCATVTSLGVFAIVEPTIEPR